ncbi:MAG: 30S ribosomal protein S17 [Elusimicrobia bacterium]|nr:30S ribosomal protein S17 [Elusimicrobiota bacterium]
MLERGKRRTRTGVVVSDKAAKTRTVQTERTYIHPMYGKVLKEKNKFAAHDENNVSKTGDKVKIMESRPMSKSKRWVVIEVIK